MFAKERSIFTFLIDTVTTVTYTFSGLNNSNHFNFLFHIFSCFALIKEYLNLNAILFEKDGD